MKKYFIIAPMSGRSEQQYNDTVTQAAFIAAAMHGEKEYEIHCVDYIDSNTISQINKAEIYGPKIREAMKALENCDGVVEVHARRTGDRLDYNLVALIGDYWRCLGEHGRNHILYLPYGDLSSCDDIPKGLEVVLE